MKPRIISEREEREIEALFQQNRTHELSWETPAERCARLQYELERRDRQWTEHWSKMHQPEKQVPLRDAGSILLWLVIIALGTCTFWAMVAVFVWGGSLWPR